jgi:hypothetical protein
MTTEYTVGKNVSPLMIVGGNSLTFSNNGINWNQVSTNIPLTTINTLEYNGTMYVAGGTNVLHSIAYSENGTTWYGVSNTVLAGCNAIKYAGYGSRGASMFIALGDASNGNAIAYSSEGINWTGIGTSMFGGNTLTVRGQAIEYNGKYWMAGASNGATHPLVLSINGTSWTTVNTTANSIYEIMWNGAQWVIAGNTNAGAGFIAFSNNEIGTSWTTANSHIGTRVTGLAYNGGRMVENDSRKM